MELSIFNFTCVCKIMHPGIRQTQPCPKHMEYFKAYMSAILLSNVKNSMY